MKKRVAIVGAMAATAMGVAGGVAAAIGDDDNVTGPEADRATEAALAATGGGTANSVERDNEDGASWEVEVTRPDGSTVDVRLDAGYKVVVIEGDSEESDDAEDSDDADEPAGAPDEDTEENVSAADADRATKAALAATGGGTAESVDRDSEDGATWEVEVIKADGTAVDVRLDANFEVVKIGPESGGPDDRDDSSESDD